MHGTKSHLDLVSTYNERQMCGCSLDLWHLTPKNEQHYFPFQFWLLFYAMEIKPLDTHFHFWLNLVNNRFLIFSQHISDPTYAYTNQKSVEVGFSLISADWVRFWESEAGSTAWSVLFMILCSGECYIYGMTHAFLICVLQRERHGGYYPVHFLLPCCHPFIHAAEEATAKSKPPSRLNGVAIHRRDSAALFPEPRCLLFHKAEKVLHTLICSRDITLSHMHVFWLILKDGFKCDFGLGMGR